jgi:glutamyl-tRNA reductase
MSIFTIGMNHRTAPIALREQLYFASDRLGLYLQDLLQRGLVREAVLLSTCNRSELYCQADDLPPLLDWFCAQTVLPRTEVEPLLYRYENEAAITHLMNVACGLDSMVLGEPQILGQLKTAYAESCSASAVDASFHRLFQSVFNVAKEIRTTTQIGACPVSVASAAVHFVKQQGVALSQASIVLLGAGDTSALLMRYLSAVVKTPVHIVNRSLEAALALAQAFHASAHPLNALSTVLLNADLVFSATGSALPMMTRSLIENVMKARDGKPLMLIDLAVPRDIETAVSEVPGVSLYCIDDLVAIIDKHKQGREHAADKANDLIHQRANDFLKGEQAHETVTHTIRAYRGHIEAICNREMDKARDQLQSGVDPELVLDYFAKAYTSKLLHSPSVQLRQAGVEGRFELLDYAKQLFSIPDPELG